MPLSLVQRASRNQADRILPDPTALPNLNCFGSKGNGDANCVLAPVRAVRAHKRPKACEARRLVEQAEEALIGNASDHPLPLGWANSESAISQQRC